MHYKKEPKYLESEDHDLFLKNTKIFNFIQSCPLDSLWFWDLNNPEDKWMNKKFWNLLGYNPEDIPHKNDAWKDLINKEDLRLALENFQKHIENPSIPFTQTIRFTHKNATTRWISFKAIAINDKNGKPFQLLVVHNDITELKKAEEKAAADLKEAERRLKLQLDYILTPDSTLTDFSLTDIIDLSLLQSIQDEFAKATGVASIITDPEGQPITEPSNFTGLCRLIRSTEKGYELCMKSDQKIGKHAAEAQSPIIEACHSCGLTDSGAPIIIGGKLIAIWMIGQCELGTTNLNSIADFAEEIGANSFEMQAEYQKITFMSIEQFESTVNLLWLFSREISSYAYNNLLLAKKLEDQKMFENELVKAKAESEEGARLKTAFLANISHEIRTPLNGLLGFIDILNDSNPSIEEKEMYLQLIHQSSNRLLDTINNIIEISMIETSQIKVNIDEFMLSEIFDELYSDFDKLAAEKGLYLSAIPDDRSDNLKIKTDKNIVLTVLKNLLDNAIKFTTEGRISFGYKKEYSFIDFFVEDTGTGIAPDRIGAIFNQFEQGDLDYTRTFEGTGLGLAIVKAYVELIGGKITVESKRENPSEGISGWSKFLFSLPINQDLG